MHHNGTSMNSDVHFSFTSLAGKYIYVQHKGMYIYLFARFHGILL